MTREDTKKLIMAIMATYPNYKPQELPLTVDMWTSMLNDFSYEQILTSLKYYISTNTSGFAPSISNLIEIIHKMSSCDELNEMQAWDLVSKALRDSTYHAEERFNELPETVQKAVGSPSQLRNWGQTDSKSIETVIQSNFMRSYSAAVKRKNEFERLPSEVKAMITQVENKLIERK